ncbi:MAG: hypothetical protein KGN35_06925, partial [Betaproteobacteria bacterium]|nr:hypothetical protein [Betaproteobacteria bacterium]
MDVYASISKESKQSGLFGEFRIVFLNLYCGIRLLAFRRSAIEKITVSYDQFFLLLGFYALTAVAVSYAVTPSAVFDLSGLGYLGVKLLIALIMSFVFAKLTGNPGDLLKILVITYCVLPFFYLISYTLLTFLPETSLTAGYLLFIAWGLAVCFYIALQLLEGSKTKAALITLLWLSASYPLANLSFSFWSEGYNDGGELAAYADDARYDVNQEYVYYNQYRLLNNALDPVKPGVAGINDLFFVGFGADSTQDVFMREIDHVQRVVNERLGAPGRSVALVNNLKTLDTTPLASSTNLRIALKHIGSKMNREEDVLFLYLTSHGSMNHELAVEMWPLDLNYIRPEDIRTYLDDADIRWRIILISACYSGGFIKALQNEHTLIFTAAASDKTSFGCANENEYTYFGEALFKNMENKPYQFVKHFVQAMEKIKQRELHENLIPSEPQLFIGKLMKEKLKLLERDIATA